MKSLSLATLTFALAACSTPMTSDDTAVPDGGATDAGPPDAGPPPLVWESCPDRFRDQCATIAVPLNHDAPDGETIDVLISRRGSGTRQLWLLQGGPGASAESFFNMHDFLSNLDPELEVYTLEHRGVGESTRLGCSAEASASPDGFQIAESEWRACQAEVVAEWGDRLDFFDTTQAAHDLALVIERTRRPEVPVFIYGGSYGTYWANRFGVLHPASADGVILDAPVQPDGFLDGWDLAFEPIGRQVFGELCSGAPRCAEHLGDDPLAFFDRVAADLAAGQCGSLGVDLDTWQLVFGIFLMDYNLRNWLPALIYRLDRCSSADQAAIATLFMNLFGGGGPGGLPRTSRILQVHIVLSELWPTAHVDDAEIVTAREEAMFFQDALRPMYALQDGWPRYTPGPRVREYMPASIPVLTLAGALDPAAPPARVGYGYREHLIGPHQTFVEIPYGAHTVLTSAGSVGEGEPSCPVQLVRAFIADPESELPVSCAPRVLHPSFDAPRELLARYWGTEDLYD